MTTVLMPSPGGSVGAPLAAPRRLRFDHVVFAAAWVFAATVPLLNAVQVAGVGTIGKVAGVPLFVVATMSVVARGRPRRLTDAHLLMLAFALWAAVSVFWSIDSSTSLATVWTLIQLLIMVWLVWEAAPTRRHVLALFQAYVLGAAGVATVLLGQALGDATDPQRYTVGESHPNSVAFVLTLAIPVAWYLASQTRSRTIAFVNRLFAILAVPSILLTGSRSALVVGSVAALIVPVCARPVSHRARRVVWILAAVVLVGAIVPLLPERPLERLGGFSEEVVNGDLNGRSVTWDLSARILGDEPAVGVGAGATRVALGAVRGWETGAHNTYLSVAVDLGAIGLTAFLLIGLATVTHGLRARGSDRAFVGVLMAVIALGLLPRHWEYERPLWLMLALVIGLGEAASQRRADDTGHLLHQEEGSRS